MTTGALRLGLAIFVLGAGATIAVADVTGFDAMHTQRRVGNKVCMIDHWHYGSGSGSTKAAAQKAAIASWQSFTDFEYGSDWARFSKAAAKKVSCSSSGGSYTCQVEARPCR
jgi:hypothetical protein